MYKRFKWEEEIRWDDSVWWHGLLGKVGDRYFIGSTMELFGDWIEDWWMTTIFEWVRNYPQRTFILLTKQPQNLSKWSPFPDNCWVGVSVCNDKMLDTAVDKLEDIQAKIKFISFEPLLSRLTLSLDYAFYYAGISWVICGAQTPHSEKTMPKIEWITSIVETASKAGIPIFLKNNLESLIHHEWQDNVYAKLLRTPSGKLRQELPQ